MTVTRRQARGGRLPPQPRLLPKFLAEQRVPMDRPIVVAGAGNIGCFGGGLSASAGRRGSLLARPRVIEEVGRCGLTLTSLEGSSWHVASQQIKLSEDPRILAEASMVLVSVLCVVSVVVAVAFARLAP